MSTPVLDASFIETCVTTAQVCDKVASGRYPVETVPCYCGASSPQMVASEDRYAMPCQTNLCPSCGLLYVSPRMTADAYQEFYELEYRKIYKTDDDHDPLVALSNGEAVLSACEFYDVLPTSVIDVGCGTGGVLRAFVQRGMTCYGVDHDPTAILTGQADGLPLEVGTAQTLIDRGITADLVILHHVLEHCLDLAATLTQMRQLLTPNGVLYIGVPGIHATPIKRMFQTAHVYHFTASTLEYVMQCEGWRALMLGEQICSFWMPTEIRRDKAEVSPTAVKDVADALANDPARIPELRTHNKFPVKLQRENVQAVLASGIPDFSAIRGRDKGQPAVIIGGGPSVDQEIKRIRLLQATGCKLVAIERMASWCQDHEIIPDYLAILDASEDVPSSLQYVHPRTVCITATQCGQAVIDMLQGKRDVYCFNCPSGSLDLPTLFAQAVSQKQTVLNAGGSVTLAAMTIAMALGMKTLHIFGFDCHVGQGAYAPGITGVGVTHPTYLEVEVDGQVFTTTGPYLSFAQQFFPLMETARVMGFVKSINVYGDSLVNAMGNIWLKEESLWPTS